MSGNLFCKPPVKTLDEVISSSGALTRNEHGMVETDPDQIDEMMRIVVSLCTTFKKSPSELVEYLSRPRF